MTTTLVDSNVLLDVVEEDPDWYAWSSEALADAADRGVLVINPIIYAEVSIGYARVEELEAALGDPSAFRRDPIPYEAAFLAGKAFAAYRRRDGIKSAPLPDFYIGAHAAVLGYSLLTRDARRYQTYFPKLQLVSPS